MKIDYLPDAELTLAPDAAYPDGAAEAWVERPELLDAEGQVAIAFGAHLLRGDDRTILVDAGVGDSPAPGVEGDGLPHALAAVGVSPDEVTDVVFTHLHFDHIGWTTVDGKPTFARARHHAHREGWEYFMFGDPPRLNFESEQDRAIHRLAPIADRIELWEKDGALLEGISARLAPGHCPGQCILEVDGDRGTVILLSDVVHNPIELIEPGWPGIADADPGVARQTAAELAAELKARQTPFVCSHFRPDVAGRIEATPVGSVWLVA